MQEGFPKTPRMKVENGTFIDYANEWDAIGMAAEAQEIELLPKFIKPYKTFIAEKRGDPNLLAEIDPEVLSQLETLIEEYNTNRDKWVQEKNWSELKAIAKEARQLVLKYTQLDPE